MSRRSYTVPVVLLLLGALAAKLLLAQVQGPPVQSSWTSYEGSRGWPWPYSRSIKSNSSEFGTPGAWMRTDFSWAALVADVAVLLIALAVAGLLLRRRYRRVGRLLQFSLGEMLLLVTIAAVACGWVSLQYRQWQRERQTIASFPAGTFNTHEEYRGPEWLRRVLPVERLTIFNRAVEVSANDPWADETTIASLVRILANAPYVHELDSRATLASHFTEPGPFANIDEVCLYSDGTADDVEYAVGQIARWPQVRKLTIEVESRQSFRSRFGRRPSGKPGTLTKEDFDWIFESTPTPPQQTNLTDHVMGWLAQMPALKYLAIAKSPDVTSEGICRLAKSTSLVGISITREQQLSDITGYQQFSDESLQLLANRVKDLYIVDPDGSSRRFQSP
jgi:hypothetical protein